MNAELCGKKILGRNVETLTYMKCLGQSSAMKKQETRMDVLPFEILKLIMMFVAQSPDGAATFVKAISSCKELNKFAADAEILRTLDFGNARLYRIRESFWHENGLLAKCANAGNERASYIIWQKNRHGGLKKVMEEGFFIRAMIKDFFKRIDQLPSCTL